jgi:hypothetical protein
MSLKALAFAVLATVTVLSSATAAPGDYRPGVSYRFTTQFRGPDMCMDVFNGGGENNLINLSPCGNYSGQKWNLRPAGHGRYRLTTDFRGDGMCLDVVNGGRRSNRLQLAPCGSYSGQFWTLSPASDGAVRLTNDFTPGRCADIHDNRVDMSACRNYSGQLWHARPADRGGY